MKVQNWGWLWIGALVACDPASGSETETESTSGADEMAGRTALPASDAAWRSADASAESARWTGGPGWAGESEGEDGFGEVDDPGAFGEEDQFSWEVFGEIQVQDGQPVGGEGGFYFLVGPPEGPQETLCSVYFSVGARPRGGSPVCAVRRDLERIHCGRRGGRIPVL